MSSKVNVVLHKQSDPAQGYSLLVQACTAARSGNYILASDLVSQVRTFGGPVEVAGLDLQARVFAQQGLLLRAEACWTEALQKDPGNPAYWEGLAQLRQTHDPRSRIRMILVSALFVATAAILWWTGHTNTLQLRQRQTDISNRLGAIDSKMGDLAAAHAAAQASSLAALLALSNKVEQVNTTTRSENLAGIRRLDAQTQATRVLIDKIVADTKDIKEMLGRDAKAP